LELLERRRY